MVGRRQQADIGDVNSIQTGVSKRLRERRRKLRIDQEPLTHPAAMIG